MNANYTYTNPFHAYINFGGFGFIGVQVDFQQHMHIGENNAESRQKKKQS